MSKNRSLRTAEDILADALRPLLAASRITAAQRDR
jgi:hypothetical protein